MIKSVKKSLWTLFVIALLLIAAQIPPFSPPQAFVWPYGWTFGYGWLPGGIALVFASWEKIHLHVFAKPNRYFCFAILIAMGISLLAFLAAIPFSSYFTFKELPTLTQAFPYYLNTLISFSLFFLAGELYWRGYLWEKAKTNPYPAVWGIALLWSLWLMPSILLSGAPGFENRWVNLAWMAAYNFAISPILLYFRIRGKSILTAALFLASFRATSSYLAMFSPFLSSMEGKLIYGGMTLLFLVLYASSLKLYSRAFWERLAGNLSFIL